MPEPDEEPEAALASQGVIILSDEHFRDGPTDTGDCWSRPFSFTEIANGYPVEREIVDDVERSLERDGQVALVGPAGSGKTTVCRMVAHRWHESRGTVIYRRASVENEPLRRELLRDAIERNKKKSRMLVVIEDFARRILSSHEASGLDMSQSQAESYDQRPENDFDDIVPLLELLAEYVDDEDVSFLLEARNKDWETIEERLGRLGHVDVESSWWRRSRYVLRNGVEQIRMPHLEKEELAAIVDQFEELTGESVRQDVGTLLSRISGDDSNGRSQLLMVMYELQQWNRGDPLDEPSHTDSALSRDVARTLEAVLDPESDSVQKLEFPSNQELLEDVALLINILNVAGFRINGELIHALAERGEDHKKIDAIISYLDGLLLFDRSSGGDYYTTHELWSVQYLEQLLRDSRTSTSAPTQFQKCVNHVIELAGNEERRDRIQQYFLRKSKYIESFERHPEEMVDVFVKNLFQAGKRRPTLSQLFGTSSTAEFDLTYGSDLLPVRCSLWRSQMYSDIGEMDTAETEARQARNRLRERTDVQGFEDLESSIFEQLGNISFDKGDFDTAAAYFRQSLELSRQVGDRAGEAASLGNLGLVARQQGDLEAALEYHEQSLKISRERGDRAGEATSLGNLGLVARELGDLEIAREYLQRSLEISRERGDRAGEATSLGNLGLVARQQGDLEAAREYHEQSLKISRERGDRAGEATSLGNLGHVARQQGDLEAARDYHQRSLQIEREIGDYVGVATSRHNLGLIALEREDFDEAYDYLEESSEELLRLGAVTRAIRSLDNLSKAAAERGDVDRALNACERAISLIEERDVSALDDRHRLLRIRAARLVETPESTLEVYYHGLGQILENDAETAIKLLNDVWEARDRFDSDHDIYPIILAAGVGVAAHLTLLGSPDARDERTSILEGIEPHIELLSTPAHALYKQLTGKEPEVTPAELIDRSEVDTDPDSLLDRVSTIECRAYGTLLKLLSEQTSQDSSTEDIYKRALRHARVSDTDPESVISLLEEAWNRREKHEPGTEGHEAAMAAGVALAAHLELLDIDSSEGTVETETVLEEVEPHSDELSSGVQSLYSYLTTDDTPTPVDGTQAPIDKSHENPTTKKLEEITFGDLMELLDDE